MDSLAARIIFLKSTERSQINELRARNAEQPIFLLSSEKLTGEEYFSLLQEGFTGVINPDTPLENFAEALAELESSPKP